MTPQRKRISTASAIGYGAALGVAAIGLAVRIVAAHDSLEDAARRFRIASGIDGCNRLVQEP